MSQRFAFLDADGVLIAHGFVETNNPDDTRIAVDADFALQPRKWRMVDGEWVAHETAAS